MAQYKVLQDIEAEDKLLGPLTLRQFIYAVIVVVLGFIAWRLLMVQWLLALPFLPPIIFFGLLAAPFGRDQSSEVWMLAKIKYFIFPRRRLWNPDGAQELVTITAPKAVEKAVTKGFDKNEATSRLKALASTMDTRGWAIKNLNTPGYVNPLGQQQSSDRLLELQTGVPSDVTSVKPNEDVLDTSNPLSQAMGSMVAQNNQAHRQAMLQKMQTIAAQQNAQAQSQVVQPAQTAAPQTSPAVQKPLPVLKPVTPATAAKSSPVPAVTQANTPAILEEVKSPSSPQELHINSASRGADGDSGEVVVSLH
jgi:hypothetical protein